MSYDNTNRWTLFRNTRGKGAEYSGTLNIDGMEFFIDGWVKEGKNGKFFSGTVKRKERQPSPSGDGARSQRRFADSGSAGRPDDDSDVPF